MARREGRLTLSILCPTCGAALPGETAEELIAAVERHIELEHPELIGRYTQDELLDRVHGD